MFLVKYTSQGVLFHMHVPLWSRFCFFPQSFIVPSFQGGFISPTSLPSVGFIYILALDVLVFVYSHCVSFILRCVLLINILCPCQPKTSLGSFVCNTSQM